MAANDQYFVSGSLVGKQAIVFQDVDHDDYVQVDAAAVALVAANNATGTFTAWVNPANITSAASCIFCAGDNNLVEFIELNIEAGLLTCRVTDEATAQFITQADQIDFKSHRWYHVAVTQRAGGDGVELFVDGKLINRTNDTTTDVDSWFAETDAIDTMRIGTANKVGDASATNDFRGAIGEVKYFDVPLTAIEVREDFEGIVNTTNLHNHWDWDDDLIDSGSGLDNGTAVGDVILSNNHCEFASRLRYDCGGTLNGGDTTQDQIKLFAGGLNNNIGFAHVIQEA